MDQNFSRNATYEDEIDLREIIKLLIKSKKLIILTTLIFTIAGYIYFVSLKPSFETSTKLEIGYIEINGKKNFIQSPNDLLHDIQIYKLKNHKTAQVNLLMEISEDRLVTIKANSKSIEKNEKLLNAIISYSLEKHSRTLDLTFNNQKQILLDSIDLFQSQIDSRTKMYQENSDENLQLQFFMAEDLFALEKDLANSKSSLKVLLSQNQEDTSPIGEFETKSIKPKIQIIITLSAVFGFITSIFLILIINFAKNFKESRA